MTIFETSSPEFKVCPFCGQEPVFGNDGAAYYVMCSYPDCAVRVELYSFDAHELAKIWNKRVVEKS